MKFLLISILLWGLIKVSVGQTREDTVRRLTKFSEEYLNELFNKRDIVKIKYYWDNYLYEDLKIGYNNGRKQYKTNADLDSLFSKDLIGVLKKIEHPITFFLEDSTTLLFDGDNGAKYFYIAFELPASLNIDSTLKETGLDFVSVDNGITWKLLKDHWIMRMMYYLYRKNN